MGKFERGVNAGVGTVEGVWMLARNDPEWGAEACGEHRSGPQQGLEAHAF